MRWGFDLDALQPSFYDPRESCCQPQTPTSPSTPHPTPAIDYKELSSNDKAAELASKIKEAVPDGIDMYFENVGGYHFEAAMATLRPKGRIAVCGSISTYNYESGTAPLNNINISQMIYTSQRIEGFVCMPWLSGARGAFLADMSKWFKDGHIKAEETFFEGVDQWPNAFAALFTGKNLGKVVVRC